MNLYRKNQRRFLGILLLVGTSTVRRSLADFPDVPLIDIGPWMRVASSSTRNTTNAPTIPFEQQQVVEAILEACRTVGFFTIVNHGVDPAVLEEAWKASADFFNLPIEEKMNHDADNDAEYPYGYEQKEQLSKGKALDGAGGPSAVDDGIPVVESKETFAIGPDDEQSGMPRRRWVDTPSVPAFRGSLEAYYTKMEGLALRLLEIFALALGQPVSFFEDKMDHHMSALRLIHYYPFLSESSNEEPRRIVRAGAHTDYGALTILNAGQPGLQVLRHDTENHNRTEWYSVPLVPGAFVINLGDLMQRWTNDEWVSTLHRVVMTAGSRQESGEPERRYSMAFFVNINGDTMIDALTTDKGKYPTISARDHLMAKHLASMGIKSNYDEL